MDIQPSERADESDPQFEFDSDNIAKEALDKFFDPPANAPKRLSSLAFCPRCGCRLSQYRDPGDKYCCACGRARNPLFDKSA